MLRLVVTISFLPSRPNVLINNLRASSLVMHAFDFFHAQFEKRGWMGVGRTPSRKLNPRWLITVTYATIPILWRVWDILWGNFSNVILGRSVSSLMGWCCQSISKEFKSPKRATHGVRRNGLSSKIYGVDILFEFYLFFSRLRVLNTWKLRW